MLNLQWWLFQKYEELNINNSNNNFINCYQSPEGYYLDINNQEKYYKKCFESCKTCNISGNETYHNCLECNNDYYYEIIILNNYKNCYRYCTYYFYQDKINKIFYCTETLECPSEFNKLVSEKKECLKSCEEDGEYKYEFRKKCYKECPEGSIKTENETESYNKYYCQAVCKEEFPFEILSTKECVKYCPIKDIQENLCILNYKVNKKDKETNDDNDNNNIENNKDEEDMKEQILMLQNIEVGFISEDYNISNLQNGEDEIIRDEKMKITLTTTQNQKNNTNNNITIIDLGECESLLRNEYNIPDDELLYMKKVDIIREGFKIPKVVYDVYSKLGGTNLVKLNLTVCKNSKVSLSIPVAISENIDKVNISSGYYNDMCYTATTDDGTDISLKDRKKEFIEGNKTVCQEDCDFSEYDYSMHKATCSCKVKEKTDSIFDLKINVSKIYENFIDIKNIVNLNLLVCYKELFNKNGIRHNIGFITIIPILIFHFISIFIFCKYKYKIDNIIKDINYGIKIGK